MTLRYGSLCTGVGGLDLAVESHFGATAAWHSEIEPGPCAVIERHWPSVPNLGDLTTLEWSAVEPIDILTAGYPCQPFSTAGTRKGASDARHLWPFVAEAVRVLRPRWVVLENVAGHLTLGFGDVLRDLAEAGFDAEWCVLRASDVGAPHGRARLFVVATDSNQGHRGRAATRTAEGAGSRCVHRGHSSSPADPAGAARRGPQFSGLAASRDGAAEPRERPGSPAWGAYTAAIRRWERTIGRAAPRPTDDAARLSPAFVEWMMGYPVGWVELPRLQALKALGNAVVPQQALAACDELAPETTLAGAVA